MPIAPDVNDPEYWHQRAKEARRLAEQMSDETQTMLMVAEGCDRFAIGAAICSIYELGVSHVSTGRRRADAPMMSFAGAGGFTHAFSGLAGTSLALTIRLTCDQLWGSFILCMAPGSDLIRRTPASSCGNR